MSTNAFESETSASMRLIASDHDDFMWLRIPDTRLLRYVTNNNKLIAGTVPCDFMAFNCGTTYFIECKSSHNPNSFRLEYIDEHQIEDLLKAEKCGCKSWFVINCRKRKEGCTDEPTMKTIAIKPGYIRKLVDAGVKSVSWDELQANGIRICRPDGRTWNLKPLFMLI